MAALDLIDLESDKYEDVFLQTVLALKIEDQDIKEEIFKNIVSINKKQRNEFLKEPAFKENFTILQNQYIQMMKIQFYLSHGLNCY